MCTVTFLPRERGFQLAMNRDEQRSRPKAQPPKVHTNHGHLAVYPTEPSGGTWVAINSGGVALALINWYSVDRRVAWQARSRGEIIPASINASQSSQIDATLQKLPLRRINPFRLIGIFPLEGTILEWRWDLKLLHLIPHRWSPRQWISSGFDEPTAQRIRSRTFRAARHQASAGTRNWCRRLHSSHAPSRGPFSICKHREDAVTVSCTEIVVDGRRGEMRYHTGPPCEAAEDTNCRLSLGPRSKC